MPSRRVPEDYRPGPITRTIADWLQQMAREVNRLLRLTPVAPLQIQENEGGPILSIDLYPPFTARLDNRIGYKYAWTEMFEKGNGLFNVKPEGRVGTLTSQQAYEDNQNANAPTLFTDGVGAIVQMRLAYLEATGNREFQFSYLGQGGVGGGSGGGGLCGGGKTFVVEQMKCLAGIITIYTQSTTLNIVNGCLTQVTGPWTYNRTEGCCACGSGSGSGSGSTSVGAWYCLQPPGSGYPTECDFLTLFQLSVLVITAEYTLLGSDTGYASQAGCLADCSGGSGSGSGSGEVAAFYCLYNPLDPSGQFCSYVTLVTLTILESLGWTKEAGPYNDLFTCNANCPPTTNWYCMTPPCTGSGSGGGGGGGGSTDADGDPCVYAPVGIGCDGVCLPYYLCANLADPGGDCPGACLQGPAPCLPGATVLTWTPGYLPPPDRGGNPYPNPVPGCWVGSWNNSCTGEILTLAVWFDPATPQPGAYWWFGFTGCGDPGGGYNYFTNLLGGGFCLAGDGSLELSQPDSVDLSVCCDLAHPAVDLPALHVIGPIPLDGSGDCSFPPPPPGGSGSGCQPATCMLLDYNQYLNLLAAGWTSSGIAYVSQGECNSVCGLGSGSGSGSGDCVSSANYPVCIPNMLHATIKLNRYIITPCNCLDGAVAVLQYDPTILNGDGTHGAWIGTFAFIGCNDTTLQLTVWFDTVSGQWRWISTGCYNNEDDFTTVFYDPIDFTGPFGVDEGPASNCCQGGANTGQLIITV